MFKVWDKVVQTLYCSGNTTNPSLSVRKHKDIPAFSHSTAKNIDYVARFGNDCAPPFHGLSTFTTPLPAKNLWMLRASKIISTDRIGFIQEETSGGPYRWVITPTRSMPFDDYNKSVQDTHNHWEKVPKHLIPPRTQLLSFGAGAIRDLSEAIIRQIEALYLQIDKAEDDESIAPIESETHILLVQLQALKDRFDTSSPTNSTGLFSTFQDKRLYSFERMTYVLSRDFIFLPATLQAITNYIKDMDEAVDNLNVKEEATGINLEEQDRRAELENDIFRLRLILANGKLQI